MQRLDGITTVQRLSAQHYPSGWFLTNPTIAQRTDGGSGYIVNCRAVNYVIAPYRLIDTDRPASSRNIVLVTDEQFRVLAEGELEYPPATRVDEEAQYKGIEDVRIAPIEQHASDYFLLGTAQELHADGRNAIAIGRVSMEPVLRRARLASHQLRDARQNVSVPMTSLVAVRYASSQQTDVEKNWMLASTIQHGTDMPHVVAVYSSEPLTLLDVDPTSGEASLMARTRASIDLSRFRGGAGPIPFGPHNESRLLVVHEVVRWDEDMRYVHRFVLLNAELSEVQALSPPLTFQDQSVEFVCGLAASVDGQSVVVTFGVHDREAWLCALPITLVSGLLRPVPRIDDTRARDCPV